ncbi:MAG TPA: protein kinase [Thermoanaerobaculia bacterium]|nr:protein kinase [Thermoanaerobaculia bacterium]
MLSPGSRLGTFEVLGPLGAGGMGEVYRAADTRLKREVAVKILPEAFAADPGRLARFEREARLLASLNHPGLAAIYGLEQDGPIRYIVMELVPGETLAEMLMRGALPLREALLIARQTAEALEAAHEKGVVHRDLKPSNIKVTPAGKVKVLDLGLAKAMDAVSDPSDASHSPTAVLDQTRPGVILGTAEFMSPEQARGKPLDKRTDIWSFGCVLFEMLSGQRPFSGETISDVIAAILSAEPDWTVLPGATPPRIQDLLRRCLEKDVAKRLRDAGDATIEIDQSLAEIGSGGGHATPRTPGSGAATVPFRSSAAPRPRAAVPAILAAAIVLGALAGWFLLRSRQAAKVTPGSGSLVVLPSRDLSGAPGGQLMGDAFVEMLSVRLGEVPGVQVVTPVAAIAASDANSDPLGAARHVGARLALRSSILRSGDAVRILYSVWDVETRRQLAGGQVDGRAADLFEVQDRLYDRISADLNLRRPADRGRTPTPPGLTTGSQQERYLQAIGSLQRRDKAPSVDEAVRLLEPLAAEAPDSALVHAALGRAYLARYVMTREKSWAARARSEAETAKRLDPAPGEVDVTLGATLLAAGERDRAEESFRRALAARPSNAEALVGLGRARKVAGDWAGAEQNFRKAIELQPYLFSPYNELGTLFFERGRYAEAADVYGRLTRITPDSYSAFSNLGGALTMTCDFDRATEAYRRALEIRPTHGSAASNFGMNQLWRGRYAEAVPSLERAAQYAPNNFQIWANLGDAYRAAKAPAEKSAAAYARSIALANESLSVNPKDAAAHSFLATSYAKTNRPREAEEQRRQALALDDKDPNVLLDAAVVSALAGRRADAVEWVRKAVDSGYCAAIIGNQPELASLRDDPGFKAIIAAPRKAAGS